MASSRQFAAGLIFVLWIGAPRLEAADTFDEDPAKTMQRFVKDALQAAADIPEHHERAHALAGIALAQSRMISKDAAKQTFQDAMKVARMLPAADRKQAAERCALLFVVVDSIVISEDWAGARAAVDDIVAGESDPPTGEIYSFLRLLVQYQCRAGQLDEATKTAEDTRFDLRDSLLQGKAEHCAAAKDWAQALRLAMDIKDLYSRTSTIVHIAEKKHDAGRKEEARRTLDGARKGVEGLDGFSKNQALTWLAQAYRRIGDRQTALQLAESITNTSPKYPAREQALSLLHAELGDIATALDFARKVREIQPDSEYCFRRVAEIQAKGKKFKDAWRTVEEMKEGYFRTQATLAIAEEQHRAGMTEDAAESFRVAVRTAENTPAPPTTFKFWPFEHASIFRQIAKTQAELGEVAAAHTWIRRQFSPKTQAYALIGAAEGLHARLEAARMKR